MTSTEKSRIDELRAQGFGYKRIARMLGVSVSTVQSHCRRAQPSPSAPSKGSSAIAAMSINSAPDTVDKPICKQCGAVIVRHPHRRQRLFCSDACRQKYWYQHRTDASTATSHICPACGQTFYTSRPQIYCSHDCYIRDRFTPATMKEVCS